MCADACQVHGVEVPELTEAVRAKLAEFLPAEASTHNPVDMIATASAEDYRRVLTDSGSSRRVRRDPGHIRARAAHRRQ